MMQPAERIDTHHHVVPPFYRDWLAEKGVSGGGLPIPRWDPVTDLALMDSLQIQSSILSVSIPGVEPGEREEARTMARRLNEFAADMKREHPDRYDFFATLTLPDVDGALRELVHALDDLGAAGAILPANAGGTYLGDPAFDELFTELERRHAVVFVHPSVPPGPGAPGLPAYMADFLLDTVRAAMHLSRTGTLTRCPGISIILAHGGGFLPFAAARLMRFADPDDRFGGGESLRRFYLDSALASSPFALPSTLAWADPTRLTFGTDSPYATDQWVEQFTQALDDYPEIDHAAINHLNARRLLSRGAA